LGGPVGSSGHAMAGAVQSAVAANGSLGGISNVTAGKGKIQFTDYTTGDGKKIPSPPPQPPVVINTNQADRPLPPNPDKHHCGGTCQGR
jgi:hypothetical protein